MHKDNITDLLHLHKKTTIFDGMRPKIIEGVQADTLSRITAPLT